MHSVPPDVVQQVQYVEDKDKPSLLLKLLHRQPREFRKLILVSNTHVAGALTNFLHSMDFLLLTIHDEHNIVERDLTMEAFNHNRCTILVATRKALRPFQAVNIDLAIIYDMPGTIEEYIEYATCTSHDVAVVFFSRSNGGVASELVQALKSSRQPVPRWLESMPQET